MRSRPIASAAAALPPASAGRRSTVTWTRPSCEPAQITCGSTVETASAEMSGKISAPVWSRSTSAAARLLGRGVVTSQVGAEDIPRAAAVIAQHDVLGAEKKLLRIVRREEDRVRPAEAVFHLRRGDAVEILRPRAHRLARAGDPVVALHQRVVVAAVSDLVGVGLRRDEGALAERDLVPGAVR